MSSTKIIRASSAHAGWMELAHRQSFPTNEVWSAEVFRAQLCLPGVFGLIAEDQGFVLARVAADEAEILTLCVLPAARRLGVARKLLTGAEHIATDWGAISQFLEVSDQNQAGIALYDASGYQRVGLRKRYYADGSDGLILRKSI